MNFDLGLWPIFFAILKAIAAALAFLLFLSTWEVARHQWEDYRFWQRGGFWRRRAWWRRWRLLRLVSWRASTLGLQLASAPWRVVRFALDGFLPWFVFGVESISWWGLDELRYLVRRKSRPLYGMRIWLGLYGKGKTASMTHYLYSKKVALGRGVRIYTNYGFKLQDGELQGWRHMVEMLNRQDKDIPVLVAFDEIATTFSQRHSLGKNGERIPEELVNLMMQCRKANIQILGTVQRFSMTEATFRRMSQYLIEVRSWFGGRLVWQKAFEGEENYEPGHDKPGEPRRRVAWSRWCIITDRVRSLYDTTYVAKRLLEWGEVDPVGLETYLHEASAERRQLSTAREGRIPAVAGAPAQRRK